MLLREVLVVIHICAIIHRCMRVASRTAIAARRVEKGRDSPFVMYRRKTAVVVVSRQWKECEDVLCKECCVVEGRKWKPTQRAGGLFVGLLFLLFARTDEDVVTNGWRDI